MNKTLLSQSLRVGITFGVIHLFLLLIGFNAMLGSLFADIARVKQSGSIPASIFLVLYCALLGVWAGYSAAKKEDANVFGRKLVRGLIAGTVAGLISAVVSIIFAVLVTNKIDPRKYLAVLSLDFMRASLFNLPVVQGVAANFGVLAGAGLAGGLLTALSSFSRVKHAWKNFAGLVKGGLEKIRYCTSGKYHLLFKIIFLVVLAAAIFFLPTKWGSYWNYVIGTVGIYVILGLGLNLIVGLSGQLVLGYIAFFAIGAYTMALLNAPEPHNLMWGFWPALALGVVLAAFAGILLGLPLMRLRGDYLAIVTLGFGEIIRILLKSDLMTSFTGGPRGIQDIKGPTIFGQPFNTDVNFMYLIIGGVLISMFIYNRLKHSRTGRAWLSIREDETVARASGVNTVKYKLLALALGAAFAGLAGGIFASRNQFTGPDEHALMASINVLSLIIVGGMGNIPGTILGAFALKGLPEILREFANFRLLAFGALLVVMMLSRPEGLIPSRRPTLQIPEDPQSDEENKEVSHVD